MLISFIFKFIFYGRFSVGWCLRETIGILSRLGVYFFGSELFTFYVTFLEGLAKGCGILRSIILKTESFFLKRYVNR